LNRNVTSKGVGKNAFTARETVSLLQGSQALPTFHFRKRAEWKWKSYSCIFIFTLLQPEG